MKGVPNFLEQDFKNLDYDLILAVDDKFEPVLKKSESLNIDIDKVIPIRVVCIPFFTLEKYNKLRHSRLSILSKNCFGTFIYNKFGLEFLSPTINMFTVTEDQFINFLKDPIRNVEKELKFIKMVKGPSEGVGNDHPIFRLGDVQWNMLHYSDEKTAFIKWHERRYKINWFNVLAIMHTKNIENLKAFDKLPYAKKICFVPFESNLDSAYYIAPEYFESNTVWHAIEWWTAGKIVNYDIWDALLYGKKTPLILK